MQLGDWALWIGLAVAALAVVALVWRAFGLKAGLTVGAALAIAAAPLLAFFRGKQSGAQAEQAKQATEDLHNAQDKVEAIQRADEARSQSDRNNDDPERLRQSDGFRRD